MDVGDGERQMINFQKILKKGVDRRTRPLYHGDTKFTQRRKKMSFRATDAAKVYFGYFRSIAYYCPAYFEMSGHEAA